MTPTLFAALQFTDTAIFAAAAVMVLGGAFGVVLSRNPVHSALSLVVTLFGIAVLFVQQEAHFLAAVQVIVYAGAIVVLFLFVIMLLGVDRDETSVRESLKAQRVLAVLFSLATFGLLVAIGGRTWDATGAPSQGGQASGPGSNIDKLSDSIFTQYLFPFEATSVLLVIAVVGAVFLARRPDSRGDTSGTGAETDSPTSLEPDASVPQDVTEVAALDDEPTDVGKS